jgi:hypothetical protein
MVRKSDFLPLTRHYRIFSRSQHRYVYDLPSPSLWQLPSAHQDMEYRDMSATGEKSHAEGHFTELK